MRREFSAGAGHWPEGLCERSCRRRSCICSNINRITGRAAAPEGTREIDNAAVPGRAGKRFFAAGPASDAAHKQENSQLPVLLSLSTAGNCSWKDSLCENSAVGVSSVP